MKYEPRVLIVEDTKHWQAIFEEILTSQDYRVVTVNSLPEAQNTLGRQSFDVAIVDIRLSEGDKNNMDGMKVLEIIRNAGDPTSIIVVSGAGDVKLTRDAFKNYHVLDFVQKDTFDVKQFIRLVEQGAYGARAYGVGPKSLTQTLLREAGITDMEISLLPGSVNGVEELLQDMFEKVWPLASTPEKHSTVIMTQSRGRIVQIVGWSKALGEAVIARLGNADVIKKESHNFSKHIKGLMGDITVKIGPFYKKEGLGGLIYVLAGAVPNPIMDFTTFYSKEKMQDVVDVVERLFRYFAGKLYSDKTVDTVKVDLSAVYRATIEALRKDREQKLEKDEPGLLEMEDEDRQVYLKEREQALYPIEFVQRESFVFESPVGMVHGDFCDGNIILDSRKRIWTLGFYNTGVSDVRLDENDIGDSPALRAYQVGKRNLLHDFATMEVSIRKTLTVVNPEAVAVFDRVLCEPKEFGEATSSRDTFSIPELNKAFNVVVRIRDLASELVDFRGDMQLYYSELLFQFLGVYLQLEDPEKERLWPSIVKLVERISDMKRAQDSLENATKTVQRPTTGYDNLPSSASTDLNYFIEDQRWYVAGFPTTIETDFHQVAILRNEIDIVLIVATDEEMKAVMGKLEPYPRRKGILITTIGPETYYLGKFGAYRTVVTKCSIGAISEGGAILATNQAVKEWRPKAIIMVGIAFGRDPEKQSLADVMVASQIISYEQQRVGKKIIYHGSITPTNPTLLNRFKNVHDWHFTRPDGVLCKIHVGAILSGEKLIDDTEFKAKLFNQFPQAIGGEMEGAGLGAAAVRTGVAWILVKSVSDWGDGKKHNKHQPLAAAAATSLVHHVLSRKIALNSIEKRSS